MKPFYRSTMKLLLCFLLVLSSLPSMYSQMLFSENLTMRIDSTKRIQGTLLPVLEFKTEKENVFTFKNTANLNLLVRHGQVINLINKIELSTYGDKVTVSGGYVHAEYRYLLNRAFEIYPYAESQWAESRGMKFKVSTGLQSRCLHCTEGAVCRKRCAGVFAIRDGARIGSRWLDRGRGEANTAPPG